MNRRIKTVPIVILFLLITVGAAFYFFVLPNKSEIKEFFREKEIVYFEDQIWSIFESPYLIDQHVIVEQGAQLTIDPGVEIILGPNARFTIYGQLLAKGTADELITFAGQKPISGFWGGLTFTAYCGFEYSYERAHPVLEHCHFRDAQQAIRTEGCPVDILNCWFQNNEKALEINQSGNIRVRNNFFLDCKEALRIHQEVPFGNLDLPEVTGNEFEKCQSILIEGSVDFGFNNVHHSASEYSAVTISPPDSHRVFFHHNQLNDHTRALEISSLKGVSVDITQNCFDNNDIHLYLECNNARDANLLIRDNNFLRHKQFKLKAIEGCTTSEQEKTDLSGNYWGTSDKNKILESFWNYSTASSVRLFSYRFIPLPCKWEDNEASSETVTPLSEEEGIPEAENTLEDDLVTIRNNLKKKLDSIKLSYKNNIKITESTISTNTKTINADSLMKAINKRLAENTSIEITIDENGNLVTNEIKNTPSTDHNGIDPEDALAASCVLTEIPDDALFVRSDLSDKAETSKHIFLCPEAKYFTHFKNKSSRIIYISKNASARLLNSSSNIVYVEGGGRLYVYHKSRGNIIYHHPDAILQGEYKSENVSTIVECADLVFPSVPSCN